MCHDTTVILTRQFERFGIERPEEQGFGRSPGHDIDVAPSDDDQTDHGGDPGDRRFGERQKQKRHDHDDDVEGRSLPPVVENPAVCALEDVVTLSGHAIPLIADI